MTVNFNIDTCPFCGTHIGYKANTCCDCGGELPKGALYCPWCGWEVSNDHVLCCHLEDNAYRCPKCLKPITEKDVKDEKHVYLFLDFDGVLNSERNYHRLQMSGLPTSDEFGTLFDEACVSRLAKIIEKTAARIVVTSSWRFIYDLPALKKMWKQRQLPGVIHSVTPMDMLVDPSDNFARGQEIEEWFKRQGIDETATPYAILDDEHQYLPYQQSHFVWTKSEVGISEKNAERVTEILIEHD